jgi:hypothetical protein
VSPRATSCRDMPHWPHRRTAGHARRSWPATAGPRPDSACIVCLRGVTPPTPRPVPCGRSTYTRACAAFRHWPEPCRTSPSASAPCYRSCRPRSSGETASTPRRAYKTPAFYSLARAREHNRPPPSAISAAGELPPPLAPVTGQRLEATP